MSLNIYINCNLFSIHCIPFHIEERHISIRTTFFININCKWDETIKLINSTVIKFNLVRKIIDVI